MVAAIQYRIIGFAFSSSWVKLRGDVFDGTWKIIVCLTRLPIFFVPDQCDQ